jgi:hypothetical protein
MVLSKQNRSQLALTLAAVVAEVSSRHNSEDAAAVIWPARFAEQALLQASRFASNSDDYLSALRSARAEIQTIREIAALGIIEVDRLTAEKDIADRKASLHQDIVERERRALTGLNLRGEQESDRQRRRNLERLAKRRKALESLSRATS